ncbi:hypothetical protein J3R83DRAFT_10292 [Lanmaoa asiatica]|nr:hypothetical protein J3R83DRAFT_10292 [Lanmaoa asiatica]
MPVPTRPQKPPVGVQSYYQAKIEASELLINQKTQNLRRLEAQRNALNARVRLLREELQLLHEPASYVGEIVKVMGKKKVLVKVQPEGKYIVDFDSEIDLAALSPSQRVALRSDTYTIHKILPNKVDPLVSLMMVEKVPDSTYEMVGGLDKQIKEIKEVIELPVKHPELFEALGIAQPKGVLLYGPPGTGKTLLARAVAHHTDCKFIRVSGSELVQKYIGEGSRMVRELFVMAREHAPSIIFMDEIDSIGSSRGESGSGGGDSEVQRTMLELLNQLDGFEATKNIKVIMATNRIDILDSALLRPGRIDRKIEFPPPGPEARVSILRIHSRKMSLQRGIDLKALAEKMGQCSGAEVRGICTEAGMYALRERRQHVTQEDFEFAIAKVLKKHQDGNTSVNKLFSIDDFFNLDASPSSTDDALFSLFLEDDFSKLPHSYDFPTSTSPDASSSSSITSHSPMFAIDPQLVGTPATSKALSDFDEDEGESDDDDPLPVSRPKPSRKGTVMSGGIKKAPLPEKENKEGNPKKDALSLRILEPEDWRPSPEEYKKMSSKEKRQLRNKISARNFRVRRKEYISTLEGDIAERDRLIDAIRSELGSSRSENVALRQEISALKKCLLEGRALPDLPPPAELPPAPASPPLTPSPAPAPSVITPNTQKDLPTSPRLSNRAFWGGLGGIGITPVHTTFVPPIAVLAAKPSPTPFSGGSPILKPSIFYEETIRSRALQENLNPALNPSSLRGLVEKKGSANINPALANLNSTVGHGVGAFDTFSDLNPFTFKTIDAYRMQLWGKMAAQQHAYQPQPQPHGLASNLKPHFFNSTSKANTAYPTPPASPKLPSKEHAAAAAIASQTLFGKLGSAFWEAFSGSPSHTSASKNWDAEKVRKVLEGRAVVRVVDVDAPVPARVPSPVSSASSPAKPDKPSCNLTEILEESMRSLTLNKK